MSNEQKDPRSNKPKTRSVGYWIAIGLAIGAGLCIKLDNLPIGMAMGVAIGIALDAGQTQKNKNN